MKTFMCKKSSVQLLLDMLYFVLHEAHDATTLDFIENVTCVFRFLLFYLVEPGILTIAQLGGLPLPS